MAEYAALRDEARRSGVKIYFAGGAHFRADVEPGGKWALKWVLKGEPAPRQVGAQGRAPPFPRGQSLVDSGSPRYGEKVG